MTKTSKGGGVVSGFVLFIIGLCLLWWNEGRTADQIYLLKEAKANYIQLSSPKVDKANDNKLVATNGKMDLSEVQDLVDTDFEVSVHSAKLVREVEVYQWVENCTEDSDNVKHCEYEKKWDSTLIDSSLFEKKGYDNPTSKLYENASYFAENVKLGEFVLPSEMIDDLSSKEQVRDLSLEVAEKKNMKLSETKDYYYNTKDDANPQIGDIRVKFYKNNATDISVLAVQNGNTFSAYTGKRGGSIFALREGNQTGAQIIKGLEKMNNFMKWLFRIIGFTLISGAISSMFGLLTKLTSKVPVLGNVVSGAVGVVSFVLGLAISFVVCAIAWFRFRPIISIVLLVLATALFVILKFVVKKKES